METIIKKKSYQTLASMHKQTEWNIATKRAIRSLQSPFSSIDESLAYLCLLVQANHSLCLFPLRAPVVVSSFVERKNQEQHFVEAEGKMPFPT